MVIKSSSSLLKEKETINENEHVLITEYLTSTNKTTQETKVEEYNTIAVSPNDHRWYRLIELRNGLRCMLVTNNLYEDEEEDDDEKSDQTDTDDKLTSSDADEAFLQYHMTTVALYIPAGSLLDPSNFQGLAHLTEHLLFSSSSKYPEINCLDKFISYHGGTIHAYTELEFTVIVIEISSNRVVETLDILIHSLIDPLMLSETIDDQIKIIDDECTIAQFDDHYRATRLFAYLAKENDPISQFSWGNKKSLKELIENPNRTNILKQFVKDRYCIPEGMNLVMISNESFRIMQQRIERLFCLMKRSFKTLPDYISLKESWNTENFKKFHLGTWQNDRDVVDYVSKFFVLFKELIMETTKVEFERLLNMFRNAKQTIDNSLQSCVDRYWTEILLNSFIFDRNNRERDALDTLTVSDMQQWYNEHIIASTRRQLIIIICSNNEPKRTTTTGIILNNSISQDNRYSFRSSFSIPVERLPRSVRRQDLSVGEDDDGHISLLKSKSESKFRCLTTKRKHNVDLRLTKSETLHINKPFIYPSDIMKLDYIIKSFESIEINDDYNNINQYRKSLKILSEQDSNEITKSYVSVNNLKQFKESCLLYNVTYIK